jgi:uncharacterized protein (TIGR02453 family)
MAKAQFSGFHPQTIQFLDELASHNNRDWFQKNKSRYESEVLEPALQFIEAVQVPLRRVTPHFLAVAKRTGGSLMRVYRDTRFSKDKTPYKTNVGIHFRHELGKDVHAPGFYLHISPEECFVGAGIWHPDSKTLAKIRKTIDKDQAGWKRVAMGKAFLRQFQRIGDSLKRPPKGFDADHPLIDELKRKDFVASAELDYDELFSDDVVKNVVGKFKKSAPMVRFLCNALGLQF